MAERFGPSPRQSLAHSDGTPRNLSGSVAIRISSSVHQKNWSRILAEHADRELLRPCDANRPNCRNPRFRSMQQVAHEAAGMDIQAKVQLINSYVNRAIRFEDDIDLYGLADHWATLAETVRHGRGDCEDFAIVKMWLLRAAGVHEQDMHLVIGRETRGERDHAVLAVRVDGQQSLYLDNLADRAYSAHDKDRFAPLVSLGAHGSFIHGYRTGAYELRR